MKTKSLLGLLLSLSFICSFGQDWQQRADYVMKIDVDTKNYQYQGEMDFTYHNNSPYSLHEVYFHLYFNAFQPGSIMDQRLKHIYDPDQRMMSVENNSSREEIQVSKISMLKPEDIGYQQITSVVENGKKLNFEIDGTILKVKLHQPLSANHKVKLQIKWKAQVPSIIRRAGKLSSEGVELSMAQWYPKVAAYDRAGWHLDEYVAREFYAPFSNFDVKIKLPHNYIVGASGELLNAAEMPGYGHEVKRKYNTWHFKADNIHDFVWAADPDFVVDTLQVTNGPKLYFVYQHNQPQEFKDNWKKAQPLTAQFFEFMHDRFGPYPWPAYSIIQGGDGGMEYGAATLITGGRNLNSLAGVIFHEGAHSWFQHLFGFNETEDEWMDEGFTSYAEAKASALILYGKDPDTVGVHQGAYNSYYQLIKNKVEEPISLLADYYHYNYTYGVSAYSKGQVFVSQLGYIIGEEALKKTFLQFYDEWKFKHPDSKDFIRIASEVSGINLKWYRNLFVNTTRSVDYAIDKVENQTISLSNRSDFAMPIDVLVTYQDGTQTLFYIPLHAMRGEKTFEKAFYPQASFKVLPDWSWASPAYEFKAEKPVSKVEIDPTGRLADFNQENNNLTL